MDLFAFNCCLTFCTRIYVSGDVTIVVEGLQTTRSFNRKDVYRATLAVSWVLGFHSLMRRTWVTQNIFQPGSQQGSIISYVCLSVIRFRLKGTSIRQARIQNSFNGVWGVEKLHFHSCFKCIYTQKLYKISKLCHTLPSFFFSCLLF